MVGTRSRAPAADVDGEHRNNPATGADEVAAEGAAAGAADNAATSSGGRPRRASARFSIHGDSASGAGEGGGSSSLATAGSSRTRSSRGGSGQRALSGRTSLERLPQLHASSPEKPPRRSARSTAGTRSQTPAAKEEQASADEARRGRRSSTRASAELNALLGLDAAVRGILLFLLVWSSTAVFLNLVRGKPTACVFVIDLP